MKSPVPRTTGYLEALTLCTVPSIERDPTIPFIFSVIMAIEMLRRPSRAEVMEVLSDKPTTFDEALPHSVKWSRKTNTVPKGVVVWWTVFLIDSCW
ncbi:hypothetical protein AMTR_s00102p00122440 [Amborella trichopoda]|uniref:Uncharacterized protein n=1 Tax=Amborella trichopoda TaxID=13333 RepID=W1NZ28_AMBTC|nr:hypothetical protein AMTR_s00102p00122440 [Amborella trichopoda]